MNGKAAVQEECKFITLQYLLIDLHIFLLVNCIICRLVGVFTAKLKYNFASIKKHAKYTLGSSYDAFPFSSKIYGSREDFQSLHRFYSPPPPKFMAGFGS